jgi:hypothetical protein
MTPKFRTATIASALCLSLAAMATPASATIVLAKASDFQGEIVLIDGAVGDTGSTILGHTNITHVGVTYDGNGETLEVLGTGQSQLSGDGDGLLNGMSYYLTDGGLFDLTEFKISDPTSTITFTVTDNEGEVFTFDNVDLASSGFIAFRGEDGQLIRNVSFLVDNGGTFEEFRQLRLDVTPIPEPATWAMMLTGFGLIGGAIRRRRSTAAIVTA